MEILSENRPLDLKLKAKSKLKASLHHCIRTCSQAQALKEKSKLKAYLHHCTRTCSQAQAHLMWCLSSINLPLIILLLSRFLNPIN